jgi:hypothetical protein
MRTWARKFMRTWADEKTGYLVLGVAIAHALDGKVWSAVGLTVVHELLRSLFRWALRGRARAA